MRTDKHRPKEIDPEAYYFVALEHVKIDALGDCSIALANREIIQQHRDRTGGAWSGHEHGDNCMICGADCIYTAVFYHEKTNAYIRTGMTCAEKMHWCDPDVFKAFKTACKEALANKAGKAKAQAILEEEGLGDLWAIYTLEDRSSDEQVIQQAQNTIADIVGKLVKYGDISEAQMKFLHGLKKRIADWPKIKAEREAERAVAEDCPTGRIVIEGVVLKTEEKINDFGSRMVMTVKDVKGFVVWGTMPRDIDCMRGDTVRFTATLEPSDSDPKFGFYKRPTKAEIISKKEFASA